MNSMSNYSKTYPSLYRGVVEDNVDPENLGRCKIRVPSVHGELTYPVEILPWSRPLAASSISKGRGSVNLPDKGDIVWILFEGANRDFPVYLGGTYATDELDISNDRVDFYVEGDSRISYYRSSKEYSITIGSTSILISEDSVRIVGNTEIIGSLNVLGDLSVSGNTTLSSLTVTGYFNKECTCDE